jgi:hypothetical protein
MASFLVACLYPTSGVVVDLRRDVVAFLAEICLYSLLSLPSLRSLLSEQASTIRDGRASMSSDERAATGKRRRASVGERR